LLLAGAGLALLFAVFAAVAPGSAFASCDGVGRAAARTLDLLLRLVPWYVPRR
jgi:Mg2+/Co2+ transporter CorB